MALIASIDPILRLIYLSVDTMNTAWHPVDLYREVRELRRLDESLRAYENFIRGAGNVDKGGGKATERYFTLLLGTRIVPYDQNHIIDITGTLITDDGLEGAFCFDKTYLSVGVSVDIQYSPKQVEVINLNFDDLVYSSFQGSVWVNTGSEWGDVGSNNFPNGNAERPVNTMALALEIAKDRGFETIQVRSDLTMTAGHDATGFKFVGASPVSVILTIESGANVDLSTFEDFTIQGVLDNGNILKNCHILDIENINGFIHQCALSGTIQLGGDEQSTIMSCYSGIPGGNLTPVIDMGGSGNPLALRAYSGGLKLINGTGPEFHSLDFLSGQIIIDSTITNGDYTIRGDSVKVTDDSTGSAVINTQNDESGEATDSSLLIGTILNDKLVGKSSNSFLKASISTNIMKASVFTSRLKGKITSVTLKGEKICQS